MARKFHKLFFDFPDAIARMIRGRRDLPPYSLRAFVGRARDFEQAGTFFVKDLSDLGLLEPAIRILEIGCGCGRIARPIALADQVWDGDLSYTGMDIDLECVEWCQRHISRDDPKFKFYHVDGVSPSYNPDGLVNMSTYQFPHLAGSFDLILATSLFTHTAAAELDHYFAEIARLLQSDGILYATFFIYKKNAELRENQRHPIQFSSVHTTFAVNNEQRPTDAIAFLEEFLLSRLAEHGLQLLSPIRYGTQEILVIRKQQRHLEDISLAHGWHELEHGCWRWTESRFGITIQSGRLADRVLRFRFTMPEAMFKGSKVISISAEVNGTSVARQSCTLPGSHVYTCRIPAGEVDVTFNVENGAKSDVDSRSLGVQVIFAEDHSGVRSPFSILPRET